MNEEGLFDAYPLEVSVTNGSLQVQQTSSAGAAVGHSNIQEAAANGCSDTIAMPHTAMDDALLPAFSESLKPFLNGHISDPTGVKRIITDER